MWLRRGHLSCVFFACGRGKREQRLSIIFFICLFFKSFLKLNLFVFAGLLNFLNSLNSRLFFILDMCTCIIHREILYLLGIQLLNIFIGVLRYDPKKYLTSHGLLLSADFTYWWVTTIEYFQDTHKYLVNFIRVIKCGTSLFLNKFRLGQVIIEVEMVFFISWRVDVDVLPQNVALLEVYQ